MTEPVRIHPELWWAEPHEGYSNVVRVIGTWSYFRVEWLVDMFLAYRAYSTVLFCQAELRAAALAMDEVKHGR